MQEKTFIKKYISITVIALNVVFLLVAFLMYARYTSAYEERLESENIVNVTNLNKSAVITSTAYFESCDSTLEDMHKYIQYNDMTLEQALDFICAANSDKNKYFQLIGSDYKGYLAEKDKDGKGFIPVDYSEASYKESIQSVVDNAGKGNIENIQFVNEFTDAGPTGVKLFALYKVLYLKGDENAYTLLLAVKSQTVREVINSQTGYEGQFTVLIDSNGTFVVNNKNIASNNLFDYIREYNYLTFEQRNDLQKLVNSNGSGELYYDNPYGTTLKEFVFKYEKLNKVGDEDWYSVTGVPLSSFKTPDFNIEYIVYMMLLLLSMLVMDVVWLNAMNRRLKVSMKREIEASHAKGNFLSRMSHEIRTPLNAIIGYNTIARNELESLQDSTEPEEREKRAVDCLAKSEIASKHLLSIINDVLDMSAIENEKIQLAHEKFDISGLITSLTTVFSAQAASKAIEFKVEFDLNTDKWFVGDLMRVNQILTNLLSNAIKFTPDGGKVVLSVKSKEVSVDNVVISFVITDNGIGMTEEYMEHIWTPFEQADAAISRRYGGTGLGLSITKNLVELMNGTISVKSILGKGTTFEVELAFETSESAVSKESYDFGDIRVLIVEDDKNSADYLSVLFERCGVKFVSVSSGAESLCTAELSIKNNKPFSLYLIDWQLPNMDGIETVRRIRELVGEQVPVVVITAYDYTKIKEKVENIGVTAFLSKPIFQSSLLDALVNIFNIKGRDKKKANVGYDFDGAKVLLAEDNMMNMEIAKNLIISAGLSVEGAWNGKEAVELFEKSEPGTYSAILMDVHMPDMNGLEATKRIRTSSHPDAKTVPVIAMTADAFADNVTEALEAGMNDHISKPIDIKTLYETLKKYIDTK